jgi:hypothetical protein
MIKRFLTPIVVLGLGLLLGSCGTVSGVVADHWPHWAGGMPDDVPPRAGAPGYEEFIAHRPAATGTDAATGKDATGQMPAVQPVNAQPASAVAPTFQERPQERSQQAPQETAHDNGPANDPTVAQGGLY